MTSLPPPRLGPERRRRGRAPARRRGRAPRRWASTGRWPPSWHASTKRAGGRASWRPTSRWMRRIFCCASSSASARRSRPPPPPTGSAPASARTGPGPTTSAARGSLDHDRGLRGAPAGGRDARRRPTCAAASAYIRAAGGIGASRVFTRIWLALFGKWPWEQPAGHAARAHAAAAVGPPQHLRLRVLGPPDRGRAHRGQRPPPGARAVHRHRRAGRGSGSPARGIHSPRGPGGSTSWTGSFTSTSAGRSHCCGGSRSGRPNAGSSAARRRTARGEGSSRPGCTHSWPCISRATPWTTR